MRASQSAGYTVPSASATLNSEGRTGSLHIGALLLRDKLSRDISSALPSTWKVSVKAPLMKSLALSGVSTVQLQPNKPSFWPVSLTQHEGVSVV